MYTTSFPYGARKICPSVQEAYDSFIPFLHLLRATSPTSTASLASGSSAASFSGASERAAQRSLHPTPGPSAHSPATSAPPPPLLRLPRPHPLLHPRRSAASISGSSPLSVHHDASRCNIPPSRPSSPCSCLQWTHSCMRTSPSSASSSLAWIPQLPEALTWFNARGMRVTDDQLKILRAYFDINNSPSEEQIQEMAEKSGLSQKGYQALVLAHAFLRSGREIRIRPTTSVTLP